MIYVIVAGAAYIAGFVSSRYAGDMGRDALIDKGVVLLEKMRVKTTPAETI